MQGVLWIFSIQSVTFTSELNNFNTIKKGHVYSGCNYLIIGKVFFVVGLVRHPLCGLNISVFSNV